MQLVKIDRLLRHPLRSKTTRSTLFATYRAGNSTIGFFSHYTMLTVSLLYIPHGQGAVDMCPMFALCYLSNRPIRCDRLPLIIQYTSHIITSMNTNLSQKKFTNIICGQHLIQRWSSVGRNNIIAGCTNAAIAIKTSRKRASPCSLLHSIRHPAIR